MRTAAIAALAVLATGLVALAAGCGSGGDETTVTESRTVTTTEPATPTETEPGTTTEPAGAEGSHGPRHFQTPSGNIGCYLVAGGARCDIRQHDWSSPPKPASCELDYGSGISLGRSGASFVCAGDTTLGGPATLAYGSSSQRGRYLCESEESGITCTDVRTGRGFFLSRERYRIF